MALLDSFEPIKRVKGVPTVTISKDGVAFSTAVLDKMNRPRYVLPMIDRSGRRFAIVECGPETDNAREFCAPGRKGAYGKRWSDRDLRSTLCDLMGWDVSEGGYRVDGSYDFDENAFVFNLYDAEKYGKDAPVTGEEDYQRRYY